MILGVRTLLASASPRRLDILRSLGIEPDVRPTSLDESAPPGADPAELVQTLARGKAQAALEAMGAADEEVLIIGADTLVVLEGTVLGKPLDPEDAETILTRLAGRAHQVMTGLCLILQRPPIPGEAKGAAASSPGEAKGAAPPLTVCLTDVATTTVHFAPLSPTRIRAYVGTGEPMDKAGAYGIQGGGGRFVEKIDGSYTNVVGFPLELFTELLARMGGLTIEALRSSPS